MRNTWIVFIACVFFFPVLSFGQAPDPGLELWRTSYTGDSTPVNVQAPLGWYGSDSLIIAIGQSPIASSFLRTHDSDWRRQLFEESVVVHGGLHSAKIMTVLEDTFFIPGVLTNATPAVTLIYNPPYVSGVHLSGGTAVSVKPTSVSAWVKYFPGRNTKGAIGIDSGRLTVQAFSSIAGMDSVTGMAEVAIAPDTAWTRISAEIAYTNTLYPVDTLRIVFASSNGVTGLDGSTLYVDDITMTSIPNPPPVIDHTGVGITAGNNSGNVFPNPAAGELYIDALQSGLLFKVYSLNGSAVAGATLNTGRNKMDISSLPEGIYFYNIHDSNGATVQRGKVVVSR